MRDIRLAFITVSLMLASCAPPEGPQDSGPRALDVKLGALGEPCSGNPSPFAEVDSIRVCGEALLSVPDAGNELRTVFDKTVDPEASLVLGSIPVNDDYRVSVLGLSEEGDPLYFGSVDGVDISVGSTQTEAVTWLPVGESFCTEVQSLNPPTDRVFGDGVALGDGRYFFGGGFSSLEEDGLGGGTLKGSDKTFLFDPATGIVVDGPKLLEGRGGHTMVYVPSTQQVLVLGGVTKMEWDASGDVFPLNFAGTDALSSVEVIDFSVEPPALSVGPDLEVPRVFPAATVTASGGVYVTGGYDWQKDTTTSNITIEGADYKKIDELVPPAAAGAIWTQQKLAQQDKAIRAGSSITLVTNEATEAGAVVEVFLVWGGTREADKTPLVIKKTNGEGAGDPVFYPEGLIQDGSTAIVPTHFHSMTVVQDKRLVALGGVSPGDDASTLSDLGDYVYVIDYVAGEGQPKLLISKKPGLTKGRIFHTAQAHHFGSVTAFGGFVDFAGAATADLAVYNRSNSGAMEILSTSGGFAALAGHVSNPMTGSGTYLGGGVSVITDLAVGGAMGSQMMVSPGVTYCESPVPVSGEGVE